MTKLSKRFKAIQDKLTPGKIYSIKEAMSLLQTLPRAKFRESIDLAINLGIDPRKTDQAIRGSVILPNGTGREVRVAVFTTGAHTAAAEKAGADIVGLEDLAEKVKAGEINFDVVIATPDAMRVVGQLGQLLGPRGLMPNPKDGTVTMDLANAVKNAKAGQVRYRTDKGGIVQCVIGKIDFTVDALIQNLESVISAVKKAKPSSAKGVYFKKVVISSTMGPGLQIDISEMN